MTPPPGPQAAPDPAPGWLVPGALVLRLMLVAALAVALSNLAYLLMAQSPGQEWAFFAAIGADNLSQGFAGTVLVAFMSSLTNRAFTATQFALLSAMSSILGRFVQGTTAGALIESLGFVNFYLLTTLLAVPGVLLFWMLMRRDPPTPETTAAT